MLNIQVQITGDKETVAKLNKLGKSLTDWTPELRKTGDFLKDFYSVAVFETEGGILGQRWSPLSPSYELYKRKTFGGRGILVRSGTMKDSYRYEVAPTYMELKNESPYAIFHQGGTKFMPKRTLMNVTAKLKDQIIDIFRTGLANRLVGKL